MGLLQLRKEDSDARVRLLSSRVDLASLSLLGF